MNREKTPETLKAVGLISGGLDSSLAVKIVQDLGVKVHAMHFVLPWLIEPNPVVVQAANRLSVPLEVSLCADEFMAMVKSPKHGYGTAMNPCIDCHIYQLRKAKEFMEKIGADFVFTGEVLGQRPMSQNRPQLYNIEKESGLQGRLLRPLSAKLLDPTILEQEGCIDREKLCSFSGRSRSGLLKLAAQYGIDDYIPTGGGCLFADHNFAKRLKDVFVHGYQDQRDLVLLSIGRHFRLSDHCKAILGRDDSENTALIQNAKSEDHIFRLERDLPGPTLLLCGQDISEAILQKCADLVRYFSKSRSDDTVNVVFYIVKDPAKERRVLTQMMNPDQIESIRI